MWGYGAHHVLGGRGLSPSSISASHCLGASLCQASISSSAPYPVGILRAKTRGGDQRRSAFSPLHSPGLPQAGSRFPLGSWTRSLPKVLLSPTS